MASPELADILYLLAHKFPDNHLFQFVYLWKHVSYALIIVLVLGLLAYFASRKHSLLPSGLQNAAEALVEGLDDFVCGIVGPKGRRYTPFIGTLFIYILFMNLSGIIPFIKSSTVSLSTTMALSICVFFYVQYTAIREMGILGYMDHLAGRPRGALAFTIVLPLFMFFLHIITEFVKPISLSLRLRGNMWGDEVLIAVLAGLGIKGLPLLVFNMLMAILTALVQAVVFCLLSTIYLALVLTGEEEHA